MKLLSITFLFLTAIFSFSCGTRYGKQAQIKIEFVVLTAERKIDVMANGKLFTSFCWYDSVYKPILYPVYASGGTEITRGFPFRPRAGESTDHRHQVGIWLNYGNALGMTKQFNEAIIAFDNAYRFDNTIKNALYFIALTYTNMGDTVKANEYMERFKRL